MNELVRKHLNELYNPDVKQRNTSLLFLLGLTEQPADWADEVWDELVNMLSSHEGMERSIAVQVLSGLAKSNPERMMNDFIKLLSITRDTNIEVWRSSLQSLWKIAVVNKELQEKVVEGLSMRFKECIDEKDCTLKRFDIIENFRKAYHLVAEPKFRKRTLALVATEKDRGNRKKYLNDWSDTMMAKKKTARI